MNTSLTAKKILSSTVVVMALAVTSACGGGDDRPSADEISKGLTKGSKGAITEKQADCAAKIIADSDLSDKSVQALADGDAKYKPTKDDTAKQAKLAKKLTGCLK